MAILFVAHMCHIADLLCTFRPQHDWRHQPAGLAARHHPVRHQGWRLIRHIARARQRKRLPKSCTHVPCSCRVRPRIACLQRGLWHRRWAQHHPWLRLGGVGDAGGGRSAVCRCRAPSHAVKLGAWLGRDSCHCKHAVHGEISRLAPPLLADCAVVPRRRAGGLHARCHCLDLRVEGREWQTGGRAHRVGLACPVCRRAGRSVHLSVWRAAAAAT